MIEGKKIGLKKKYNDERLNTKLLPHQVDFIARAQRMERDNHGGLNGSEMGTGKTFMMLALHAMEPSIGASTRTLIVCPLGLLNNWANEGRKHIKNLSQTRFHGPRRSNTHLDNCEVVITTYDVLRLEYEQYGDESILYKWAPKRVVLDEAHEIKNQKTRRHEACMWIGRNARFRWCVTGTPIQNGMKDLRSLRNFIDWEHELDIDEWKKACYIRYRVRDLKLNIPEKIINTHNLELEADEIEGYRQLKETVVESYDDGERMLVVLTKILRLRQYCNKGVKERKVRQILDAVNDGEKTIIFSQFVQTLEMLEVQLADYEPLMYHGGLNGSQKESILEQFANGESRVLLMSLKAGGVGLNITSANHVIMYEPWWNLSIEEQAWARVHRLGQTKQVHIHRFKVLYTIEEWLHLLQEEKKDQSSILDLDEDFQVKETITKAKLKELFRNSCY